MIELDILGEHLDRAYPILAGLVVPRPIAWVTTLNGDGSVNLAPFSFFNVFGDDPPLVIFAPGDRDDGTPKDTALNCARTGEFVVNLVSEDLREIMNQSAAALPYGASEIDQIGIPTSPSSVVAPPRLSQAPAALECKVHEIKMVGTNRLVLGIVHRVWVQEEFFDLETLRVRGDRFHPIGRMSVPNWYCHTTDVFRMVRPK